MASSGHARVIGICAEDTDAAAAACRWAVREIYRDGDKFHLMYVVKSLKPPMEVFHPGPGTAYSFSQPGKHHEEAKILAAKKAIESRFVPVLDEKFVPYEIHLFAENHDAKAEKIGQTILKCAEGLETDLVVIARHNQGSEEKDRFTGNVGSVAAFVSKHCKHPVAIVDPENWRL